jgi:hypothetical protein
MMFLLNVNNFFESYFDLGLEKIYNYFYEVWVLGRSDIFTFMTDLFVFRNFNTDKLIEMMTMFLAKKFVVLFLQRKMQIDKDVLFYFYILFYVSMKYGFEQAVMFSNKSSDMIFSANKFVFFSWMLKSIEPIYKIGSIVICVFFA